MIKAEVLGEVRVICIVFVSTLMLTVKRLQTCHVALLQPQSMLQSLEKS